MPEEENAAVEETKTAEEEKAEAEEAEVEEKAVEEAEVEEKTTEPVKEAPDAKEETKTSGGSGGSSTDASEEAIELLKAALPEALPLGAVLKVNSRKYFPNEPGTPSENYQGYIIGLPDGNVGKYIPAGSGLHPDAGVLVMSYDDMIEGLIEIETGDSLESVFCGCSMPSKDSTQFVANITVVNTQDK